MFFHYNFSLTLHRETLRVRNQCPLQSPDLNPDLSNSKARDLLPEPAAKGFVNMAGVSWAPGLLETHPLEQESLDLFSASRRGLWPPGKFLLRLQIPNKCKFAWSPFGDFFQDACHCSSGLPIKQEVRPLDQINSRRQRRGRRVSGSATDRAEVPGRQTSPRSSFHSCSFG